MKKITLILVIIWIIIFFKVSNIDSCTVQLEDRQDKSEWHIAIYSWSCFKKNYKLAYSEYQNDYCIYQKHSKWWWVTNVNDITFFKDTYIYSDVIMKKEDILKYIDCEYIN